MDMFRKSFGLSRRSWRLICLSFSTRPVRLSIMETLVEVKEKKGSRSIKDDILQVIVLDMGSVERQTMEPEVAGSGSDQHQHLTRIDIICPPLPADRYGRGVDEAKPDKDDRGVLQGMGEKGGRVESRVNIPSRHACTLYPVALVRFIIVRGVTKYFIRCRSPSSH